MAERPNLRDRRRQETRIDISWAAIQLTVEHGLPNVTTEDIAREAGVSPRTVNNYFSSKAEAIVARHYDRARGIADHLRARPAAEPLWTALRQAALAQFDNDRGGPGRAPDPGWTAGVRLMLAEPALTGEFLKANAAAEEALAEAIAERLGAEPTDLRVVLSATTVSGVLRAAILRWLNASSPIGMDKVLNEAFDTLDELLS
jgi:AcrR family transcriptional regulator